MTATANMDELLSLARDKSVAGRTSLVGAVSDLYFDHPGEHGEREIALMTKILRQLIHDVEMSVRRSLAVRLAERGNAPRELVLTLANDQIEVAHPILTNSSVLGDEELIEIVRQRSAEHLLAVAMRRTIDEPVSQALAESGNVGVIKTLLENRNAEISRKTMAYLVEQSERIDALHNPLLRREDLGADLAGRMYAWVSDALREHIVQNFEVDREALEESLRLAVEEASGEPRETPGKAASELAEHLRDGGAITPKFLIQVLRAGEIALFESLFAKYTRLDETLVKRILYEPGGHALAIACKAVAVEKSDFASLFLLSRQGRPGDKTVEPRELTGVMAYFDSIMQAGGNIVLQRWRRDPGYVPDANDPALKLFKR